MGNKQASFTQEQLDAYQVKTLFFGKSLNLDFCFLSFLVAKFVPRRGHSKTCVFLTPLCCISLQDCTFFTRKEIKRYVSSTNSSLISVYVARAWVNGDMVSPDFCCLELGKLEVDAHEEFFPENFTTKTESVFVINAFII